MDDEFVFLYKEHLEYSRLYLWYTGSKFSFFKGKTSKVEADRYKYLSGYFFEKAVAKARKLVVPR